MVLKLILDSICVLHIRRLSSAVNVVPDVLRSLTRSDAMWTQPHEQCQSIANEKLTTKQYSLNGKCAKESDCCDNGWGGGEGKRKEKFAKQRTTFFVVSQSGSQAGLACVWLSVHWKTNKIVEHALMSALKSNSIRMRTASARAHTHTLRTIEDEGEKMNK